MEKKNKIITLVLAILIVAFALIALYFNVLVPRNAKPATTVDVDKPIPLNNTLKTSVTVLPAPDKK